MQEQHCQVDIIETYGSCCAPRTDTVDQKSVYLKFIFSLILTLPLIAHMFSERPLLHNAIFQFLICLPVYLLGVSHFGKSALKSVQNASPNMDVLIFIGSSAAFIYSCAGLALNLGSDFLFFETTSAIITLVLFGNLLEEKALRKTTKAVEELASLRANTAQRVNLSTGLSEIINFEDIKENDTLIVNTGEIVPTDGVIVSGQASINEAVISGESLPVLRKKDDAVIGGSIVEEGSFHLSVRAIGENTVLSHIIRMVEQAFLEKPNIQKLGDKVSNYFVPTVIIISVLTFFISYFGLDTSIQEALLRSIAVLVVSCPCAMGLATPTAVFVAVGKAAQRGILVRNGKCLEALSKIKTAIFDKTGTLTTGDFLISERDYLGNAAKDIEGLVSGLVQRSSHPISLSLRQEISAEPSKLINVIENPGKGIVAEDSDGNSYRFGSALLMDHIDVPSEHDLYLIRNNELLAWFDIKDQIHPNVIEMIFSIKDAGVRTMLLSGDRFGKVKSIADEIKIDQFYAEKNPEDKLKIIQAHSERESIAFIGDGINDAPAINAATVGVSINGASAVALESADVILPKNDISSFEEAFKFSKICMRTIKQNLFWALAYNVVAIPVAAAGYLNPMLAALSMAFSDLILIGNSLRVRLKKW